MMVLTIARRWPAATVRIELSVGLAALLACAGCSLPQRIKTESKPVLDPQGPSSLADSYSKPADSAFTPGDAGLFERSYFVALAEAQEISTGTNKAPTASTDPSSIDSRQMAIDGISLVDAYCWDFFIRRGKYQMNVNLARDIVTAAGTAATAVVGLASHANAAATGGIALFTATAYNGMDIYTRNFLFGADNIETVHTMVTKALVAHATKVLPSNDTSVWTFAQAVEVINDHQTICTPSYIRGLVVAGIKSGTVTAATPSGTLFKAASAGAAGASGQAAAAATAAKAGAPQEAVSAAVAAGTRQAVSDSGKIADDVSPAMNEATLSPTTKEAARQAAIGAGATASQAEAIATKVTSALVPAVVSAASAPVGPVGSRHVTLMVNGQAAAD